MKITKRTTSAVVASTKVESSYNDALDYIQSAIQSLTSTAMDRQNPKYDVARESIANLGVILLDLKSQLGE